MKGGDRERSDASCRYVRMYAMYVCPDQVVRATAARGLSFLIILAVNVIVIYMCIYSIRSDSSPRGRNATEGVFFVMKEYV